MRLALFSTQQTALLTFINTNPNHSRNPIPVSVPKHRGNGCELVNSVKDGN